jgi:hypothetical protein
MVIQKRTHPTTKGESRVRPEAKRENSNGPLLNLEEMAAVTTLLATAQQTTLPLLLERNGQLVQVIKECDDTGALSLDFGGMALASTRAAVLKGACGLPPAGPRACGAPSIRLFLVGVLPSSLRP